MLAHESIHDSGCTAATSASVRKMVREEFQAMNLKPSDDRTHLTRRRFADARETPSSNDA